MSRVRLGRARRAPATTRGPVAPAPAPGAVGRHRLRPRVDWELVSCGLHGHHLVGTDAAVVRDQDHQLVREIGSLRWHRCLRCDSWVLLPAPARPRRRTVPSRAEIEVPLRGAPLRDRFVLRLISVERALHILVMALLVLAVFLFAAHAQSLRSHLTQVLGSVEGAFGASGRHGVLADLARLFSLSTTTLYLIGVGLAAYTAVLLAETIGLWFDRRWAEYLTFVETSVLVPYEVYELVRGATAFKIAAFAVNVAILLYLALIHRLFGVRGGLAALRVRRESSSGWPAIDRATPPTEVAATPTEPPERPYATT